jgi:hypothetical protein
VADNVFDRFDAPAGTATGEANAFDRFDAGGTSVPQEMQEAASGPVGQRVRKRSGQPVAPANKSESLRGNPSATADYEVARALESGEVLTDAQRDRAARVEQREFERFGRVAADYPASSATVAGEQFEQMVEGGKAAYKERKAAELEKHGPWFDPLDMDADLRVASEGELRLGKRVAADMRASAAKDIEEVRAAGMRAQQAIPAEASNLERNIIQGTGSALVSLPTILGSQVATGSPVPGIVALGTGAAGARYGELRGHKIPEDVAARSATMLGALEGLTEFIPGSTLVKKSPLGKKALEFFLSDILGENVSTLAEIADDYRLQLRDDVTLDDLVTAVKDTTVLSIVGGGVQLGTTQLLQTALEKVNSKGRATTAQPVQQPQQGPQPVAADEVLGPVEGPAQGPAEGPNAFDQFDAAPAPTANSFDQFDERAAAPASEAAPVAATAPDQSGLPDTGAVAAAPTPEAAKAPNPYTDERLGDTERRASLEGFRREIGQVERQGRVRMNEKQEFLGKSRHVASPIWDARPGFDTKNGISAADANDALDRLQAGKPLKPKQQQFISYLLDEQDSQQAEFEQREAELVSAVPDWSEQDEVSRELTHLADKAQAFATPDEIEAALEALDDQEAFRRLQTLVDRGWQEGRLEENISRASSADSDPEQSGASEAAAGGDGAGASGPQSDANAPFVRIPTDQGDEDGEQARGSSQAGLEQDARAGAAEPAAVESGAQGAAPAAEAGLEKGAESPSATPLKPGSDLFGVNVDNSAALNKKNAKVERKLGIGRAAPKPEDAPPGDIFRAQADKEDAAAAAAQTDIEQEQTNQPGLNDNEVRQKLVEYIRHRRESGAQKPDDIDTAIWNNESFQRHFHKKGVMTVRLRDFKIKDLWDEAAPATAGPQPTGKTVTGNPSFDEHSGIRLGQRVKGKRGKDVGTVKEIFQLDDKKAGKLRKGKTGPWVRALVNWSDRTDQYVDIDELQDAGEQSAAATSPSNNIPEPTVAQKEAGNYAKDHRTHQGLDIAIENPAGSWRWKMDTDALEELVKQARTTKDEEQLVAAQEALRDSKRIPEAFIKLETANKALHKSRPGLAKGIAKILDKAWFARLAADYGYIKGYIGKDKDHLDVYVDLPRLADDSKNPVWVMDQKNPAGAFDEHKVFMGFENVERIEVDYVKSFDDKDFARSIMGPLRKFNDADAFKRWLATGDLTKPVAQWKDDVQRPAGSPQQDRPAGEVAGAQAAVQRGERGEPKRGAGKADRQTADGELSRQDELRDGVPAAAGERGNQPVRAEGGSPGVAQPAAGSDQPGTGADPGGTGTADDLFGSSDPVATAERAAPALDRDEKRKLQRAAEGFKVILGDRANIAKTLPFLMEEQHDDVAKAEARFERPDGYGFLFTNGTGTGKTYVGLGWVKRMVKQGKTNGIIGVPSQKIAQDWIDSAKDLGLNITVLEDTQDAGKGIVITTYANLANNRLLADRNWDWMISDESHRMMKNADANDTSTLDAVRAITLHTSNSAIYRRTDMLHRDRVDALNELNKQVAALEAVKMPIPEALSDKVSKAYHELDELRRQVRADVLSRQGEKRPRTMFLSATPFAYEKNVKWAEGYLFEFESKERGETVHYNEADGYNRFMVEHFGYRMRYNKLTEPEPNVDRSVMQRQFNTWLRKEGVLSARTINVPYDYDRKFVLVDSKVGNKIDEGLEWLRKNKEFRPLAEAIEKRFDFLSRSRLLQALKARESVDYIRAQHKLGRKVIAFYDYNEGGGFDVFDVSEGMIDSRSGSAEELKALVRKFRAARPDLVALNTRAPSPLETLMAAFPNAKQYNGLHNAKKRGQWVREFNDDNLPQANLILAQKDANEGWSAHDTTGKHQRVLINLGLPTAPTVAIQQEGRIYRLGQMSDSMFRYFNTGTNWERYAFASTIARRASTAENLAQGEDARGLLDSFVQAFEDSDQDIPGSPEDGKGGKAKDRAFASVLSEYDRAKTFYFANQKKTAKTKSAEGDDYFATPEPLGFKMVEWARAAPDDELLEPSAGHGAIARFFPALQKRTVVEKSPTLASRLALATDAKLITGEFEDLDPVNKFDVIVMNPPFGFSGATARDHIDKAFTKHLREGGRIVALVPEGGATPKFEKWLDETPGAFLVAEYGLPTVTFGRAGTGVKTRVLVIDKATPEFQKRNKVTVPHGKMRRDISGEDIKEFFENLENYEAPERVKVEALTAAPAAPTSAWSEGSPSTPNKAANGQFTVSDGTHSKTGAAIFYAHPTLRVHREVYDAQKAVATRLGGYWSSWKGGGAKPGFIFKTKAARDQFIEQMSAPAGEGSFSLLDGDSPVFYSAVEKALVDTKTNSAPVAQWRAFFRNLRGIRAEEMEWLGVDNWLDEQTGNVTRQALLDYVRANKIEVEEVVKGGPAGSHNATRQRIDSLIVQLTSYGLTPHIEETDFGARIEYISAGDGERYFKEGARNWQSQDLVTDNVDSISDIEALDLIEDLERVLESADEEAFSEESMDGTRYETYATPGGTNYRELLLTLPEKAPADPLEQRPYKEGYRSHHWSEPNILAHVRFNERTDQDGKRVLFIEEIQSDWHQAGRRRGYKKQIDTTGWTAVKKEHGWTVTNAESRVLDTEMNAASAEEAISRSAASENIAGVPNAPFKTTWPELAFKRALRWAAENGFDRVAWTTGDMQNARYNLAQDVDTLKYWKANGEYRIGVMPKRGTKEWRHIGSFKPEALPELVGAEVAAKIIAGEGELQRFDQSTHLYPKDLEIGGSGMRGFYDKLLPQFVDKYVKKWGGKVGKTKVEAGQRMDHTTMTGYRQDYADVQSVDITPEMRNAALSGQPLFRHTEQNTNVVRADKPRTRITKAALEAHIDKIRKSLPLIDVYVVDGFEGFLPQDEFGFLQFAASQKVGPEDFGGIMWKRRDGRPVIYLNARGLDSLDKAEKVLFHEAFHRGIRAALGEVAYSRLADHLFVQMGGAKAFPREMSLYFTKRGRQFNVNDPAHRLTMVDEALAHLTEFLNRGETLTDHLSRLLDRILAWLNRFLRELGWRRTFSRAEIKEAVRGATEVGLSRSARDDTIDTPAREMMHFAAVARLQAQRQRPSARLSGTDEAAMALQDEDRELAKRQNEFWNNLKKGQYIERAIRLAFLPPGLTTNDKGEWTLSPLGRRVAARVRDSSMRAARRSFKFLRPLHDAVNREYQVDAKVRYAIDAVKNGLVDRHGTPPEFVLADSRAQNYKTQLLDRARKMVEDLEKSGMVSNRAEAEALQAIMTGENPGEVDAKLAAVAEPMRQVLDQWGAEAVELGLLDKATYERNRATYLHRVYRKHEADLTGASGLVKRMDDAMTRRRRKIIGNQFKRRGIAWDVSVEKLRRALPADWWQRKTDGKKIDVALGESEWVVLSKVQNMRDGTPDMLAGDEQAQERVKGKDRVLDRVYWPAELPIPAMYAGWRNDGTFKAIKVAPGSVTLWRDFTKPERMKMGEILDIRYTFLKTAITAAHDLATGRLFRDIAMNPDWARDTAPATDDGTPLWEPGVGGKRRYGVPMEWTLVPDAVIPGTSTKRYGAMAGKYILSSIWRDLNELEIAMKPGVWRSILTQFKKNKTTRNPKTHIFNTMSNVILAYIDDMRASDFARGIKEWYTNGPLYEEARLHGVFGHDFVDQEIKQDVLRPMLEKILKESNADVESERKLRLLTRFFDGVRRLDQAATRAYQWEDEVFRMASYMQARNHGMGPDEAAIHARKQFIDYDIRAPWVNSLRQTVLPFVAYTYRAIPRVMDAVSKRPWKIATLALMSYAVNEMAYWLMDEDDDDEDEQRRLMNEHARGNTWAMTPRLLRTPMNDEYGNPVFLDMRNGLPAANIVDFENNNAAIPMPAWLQIGGPMVMGVDFMQNYDAYRQEEISDSEVDTTGQKLAKAGKFLWTGYMPSWAPGGYNWDRVAGAAEGRMNQAKETSTIGMAVAQSILPLTVQSTEKNRRDRIREYARKLRKLDEQAFDFRIAYQKLKDPTNDDIADYREAIEEIKSRRDQVLRERQETLNGEPP